MQNLREKAIVFAKPYIDQGLAHSKATQLPFKAHTSTNGKIGIVAAIFIGSLALAGVTALVSHSVARHTNRHYRKASDEFINKIEKQCNCVHDDVEDVIEDATDKVKKVVGKIK